MIKIQFTYLMLITFYGIGFAQNTTVSSLSYNVNF
jgi:hypothetical protein